jgi:2-polyprenyl-6-methoxyphenol hydroxylase-like FAD-dependent oxidoreductase
MVSMSSQPDTPVLIAGGGPVGLAVAMELSMHGVASTVIETRTSVSWLRPRAKTTSARTMEHFRRWGIASTVRERAPLPQAWSDEVVFCTTLLGSEVTRFDRCFGLDLRHDEVYHDELTAEGGQQAPQPLIEFILREAAARRPEITLVTGASVTGLKQDDDGVLADIHQAGGVHQIRARYAIGCDGPRSTVREQIGVRMLGEQDSRPNYNVVFRSDALWPLVRHGNAVQYWVLSPRQPGLMGPMDLAGTWWCIAFGVEAEAGAADPAGLVGSMIGDHRVPAEILAGDPWQATMQLAERYAEGRIFLAGDAAHLNPPFGGHGFNTGIGDAVNIGWKLAAVLNGWAPSALLDSYEAERRPVAARTIEAARRNLRALAGEPADPRLAGTDEEFAAIRPAVAEVVQRTKYAEFHSLGLVLGTAYPDSPIVAPEPGAAPGNAALREDVYVPTAAPGHRLPHVWLNPTESLYDRLGPGYTLVGDLTAPVASQLSEAAAQLHIPLRTHPFAAAQAHFGAPVVLVRPDQHVAWRGHHLPNPRTLWCRLTGVTP